MPSELRLGLYSPWATNYQAPLYRRVASDPRVKFTAIFGSDIGVNRTVSKYGDDVYFGGPILDGYQSVFLRRASSNPWNGGLSLHDWDIVRVIRQHRFDVLWLNGYNSITHLLAASTQLMLGGGVLVREEQTLLPKRPIWRKIAKNIGLRALLRQSSGLFIGSENRKWFLHWGVAEHRLFYTPYAVDNARLQEELKKLRPHRNELRAELGVDPAKPVILTVGRLAREKQPQLLLEAFRQLRAERVASLVFVGSGPLEDDLRRSVNEQKIPDVTFAGFFDHPEIGRAYAAADIFVLPSQSDTWGLVVNEAMNFGLPIVLTDAVGCGSDLVVDGENGFIVPSGDPLALADRLRLLTDEPELRRSFGITSQHRILEWNYDTAAEGVVAGALGAVRTANRFLRPVRGIG